MSIVTRFAPSPTGYLHLGHAHAALVAWRRARRAGGRFLLRIEDIDSGRCRPAFTAAILDDLAWLGLDWDGPVRVQSEHAAEYRGVLDGLTRRGLLYPCFCSRADIQRAATAPHGPEGAVYPGTCRGLDPAECARRVAAGQPYALRLDMGRALAETGALSFEAEGVGRVACHPERFGDVVLGRRDAAASYHLCVTHDDALQGVTLVTRAADLAPATDVHRVLQALMGWPAPRYHHHALLTDAQGRRLAKRDGASTLRDMRAAGLTPAAVLAQLPASAG
ncbi:MAG: tRNA glutamyl-Q(34) synthetase GluQRS [Acetobacteraceae bacterium]